MSTGAWKATLRNVCFVAVVCFCCVYFFFPMKMDLLQQRAAGLHSFVSFYFEARSYPGSVALL